MTALWYWRGMRSRLMRSLASRSAAEREASDRINRDRIPRQYHKAVKAYFSNIQRSVKESKPKESMDEKDKPDESPKNEPATPTAEDKSDG